MTNPTAILAIPDPVVRGRVGRNFETLNWRIIEASGGAEALAAVDRVPPQAVIMDTWLPDLEISEFVSELQSSYPHVDFMSVDGSLQAAGIIRNVRRAEILHALRTAETVRSSFCELLETEATSSEPCRVASGHRIDEANLFGDTSGRIARYSSNNIRVISEATPLRTVDDSAIDTMLPEFVGRSKAMVQLCDRIRLIAPHKTAALIQGPSGTGKELVANAIHRLSGRADRPFVAINCAAIPDTLLEAELFGHLRGSFTGALQNRIGRIEAANGGTLFLDEIGEMPLPLQSKLLRFLESGEVQRIGSNGSVKLDVRVIAATHQDLLKRARDGHFRADVYYRLAVFPLRTPALVDHPDDIPALASHFLNRLCASSVAKSFDAASMQTLCQHTWPGNVRELAHAVERAYVLSSNRAQITRNEIELDLPETPIAQQEHTELEAML